MGLNPYGLTYHLGLQARGTARANPAPAGLEGFIAIATEIGARAIELWEGWLKEMGEAGLASLRARLEALDMEPVVSSGLQQIDIDAAVGYARALGARYIRVALTPILCGDRNAAGERWGELVASVHDKLGRYAPVANAAGVRLLIENHQDFTSRELVAFCDAYDVNIVYDTANSFPVAEAPMDFTAVVAPYVRYAHAKDYRVQVTDEGFRLCRCASGDGAVPFKQLFDLLLEHNETMLASIEIGALEARHVRLFTPDWWRGYAPRSAAELAACLRATRTNHIAEADEWRTPWERNADGELVDYELGQVRKSAANLRALGFM
jgi:sugar phosphate isomerase/epimerase